MPEQVHPNCWSEAHPDSCPTCRVCPDCFRPRRPEQYPDDHLVCLVCKP